MAESEHPQNSKVATVKSRGANDLNGFIEFIREQGVVGLAIDFIVGATAVTFDHLDKKKG